MTDSHSYPDSGEPNDREVRAGAHLLKMAKSYGWPDDGEGALEFMLRRAREVAFEDCGALAQAPTMEIVDREYYEGVIAELKEAMRLTRQVLSEEMDHLTDSLEATTLPSTDRVNLPGHDETMANLDALTISPKPRCTCAAIVNPNIPHARSCPLYSTDRGGK